MTHAAWWRKVHLRRDRVRWAGPRGDVVWALHVVVSLGLMSVAVAATASEPTVDERPAEMPSVEQRPFAFVVDPSTPARGSFAVAYTLGLGSGISAERPIPVVLQASGVSNDLAIGYGVTSWFEPTAEVTTTTSDGRTATSAMLGMKLQLTPPHSAWRAAAMAGGLREGQSGDYGVWVRGAGSFGAGSLLLEVNAYAESVFATGRDSVDYAVMVGASWRCLDWLRAGAEYVGQDLEEIEGEGAEGGARQAVGPSVALDLGRGRYQVVGATLFGVGDLSPKVLVRVGLLGTF